MNSTKLQDTKLIYENLSCFYTLMMKYQKETVKKNPVENHIKKNKIPRNKLKQESERPIL